MYGTGTFKLCLTMYIKLRTVTRGPQHKIYNGNKYLVVVCEKLKHLATLVFLSSPALQLKWSHVLCGSKHTHASTHAYTKCADHQH